MGLKSGEYGDAGWNATPFSINVFNDCRDLWQGALYCLSSTITNNDTSSSSSLSKANASLFLSFDLPTEDFLFAFLALTDEPTELLRLEPPARDN